MVFPEFIFSLKSFQNLDQIWILSLVASRHALLHILRRREIESLVREDIEFCIDVLVFSSIEERLCSQAWIRAIQSMM